MNAPHFDDESLSAALDGDQEAVTAHLAECADCRARSSALAGAAQAVAADPVPPAPPGLADRAVAAALAAFDAERAAGAPAAASAPTPASTPPVVPLRRPAGPADDSFTAGARRRPPAWVLGIAAALAAVLVAVPVIASLNSSDSDNQTVASPATKDSSRLAAGAGGAVRDGGDLGDQFDQVALGSLVASALGEEGPTASSGSGAAAADEAQRSAEAAGPTVAAAAPAPAASATESSIAFAQDAGPPADPAAVAACEQQVARESGSRLGTLVYRATLRWQGKPAVVLAYKIDGASGALDHQAVVMALPGCEILVAQGF